MLSKKIVNFNIGFSQNDFVDGRVNTEFTLYLDFNFNKIFLANLMTNSVINLNTSPTHYIVSETPEITLFDGQSDSGRIGPSYGFFIMSNYGSIYKLGTSDYRVVISQGYPGAVYKDQTYLVFKIDKIYNFNVPIELNVPDKYLRFLVNFGDYRTLYYSEDYPAITQGHINFTLDFIIDI